MARRATKTSQLVGQRRSLDVVKGTCGEENRRPVRHAKIGCKLQTMSLVSFSCQFFSRFCYYRNFAHRPGKIFRILEVPRIGEEMVSAISTEIKHSAAIA